MREGTSGRGPRAARRPSLCRTMLALSWQYLLGRAVATDHADRTRAEWPPHPDRVFQALVAAWGERGCDAGERAALEWLEGAGPPQLAWPSEATAAPAPKIFVPTNDIAGPRRGAYGDAKIALLPSLRKRKERRFPATVVGDGVCSLVWPLADAPSHRPALARLAGAVTHVGHSSALVRAWLDDAPPAPRLRPASADDPVDVQLRVPHPGRLQGLRAAFSEGGAGWQRPSSGTWCPYTPAVGERAARTAGSGRLVVLARRGGATAHLGQTLALTSALRGVLAARASGRALELVSGHGRDGAPLATAHVAYVPLAAVGGPRADGHLVGLGLALPRELTGAEELAVLEALARALDPETDAVEIAFPDGRAMTLAVEERPAPPVALRPATWARAARAFGTVTPIVLDRQAPRRHRDRDAFAAAEIARACARIGAHPPAEVRVLEASPLPGVPPVAAFPPLPTKAGGGRRHVHAWLRFDEAVRGPLVLGAGRFRGYGLCAPLPGEEEA